MLLRTITAIILLSIAAAMLFIGEIAVGIILMLFTLIGINELYKAAEKGGYAPLKLISGLFVVPILFYLIDAKYNYFSICIYIIASLVMLICIIKCSKYSIMDAVITIGAGAIIANMFYCILAVYKTGNDKMESALLLLLILVGVSVTDTFAYFIGSAIGKHKLCPEVSPKKSIEGSIGGMIFVTLAMSLYGYYVVNPNVGILKEVPVYAYAVLGIICGVISQIGDLTASMIKRQFDIKDYGKIFPGHGGILDRFDSFIFVAPVIYFFINTFAA